MQAGAKIVALSEAAAVRGAAVAGGGLPALQRCRGAVRLGFARRGDRTVVAAAHQAGSLRVRFPRPDIAGGTEAVLINTSGGMTDGDRQEVEVAWHAGAAATVTTQAAERIYRSRGPDCTIATSLKVAPGATALWLPQETILFDGCRLARRTDADVAPGGRLIACEALVFGRAAMGETVTTGGVADRWRVRQGGRLAFMDGFRLDGAIAEALARPAVAAGNRAMATVLAVGGDAGEAVAQMRAAGAGTGLPCGATRIGAVAVMRLLAADLRRLHAGLMRVLGALLRGLDAAVCRQMPTVWSL